MNVRGLIFDCDGTLVDSLGQAMESFNYALDEVGYPPRPVEAIKRYFGAGADRILQHILGNEAQAAQAFERYLDHQSHLAARTRLHDGVLDLLERVHGAGLPMAVVTGRHARDLEIVLRPHRVHDYFQTQIADNHVPHSKPAPDGILLACTRLGLPPEQTAYIGDSTMDMVAAKAAGSFAVAALWDELTIESEMRAAGAQALAATPADVWRVLGGE